MANMRCTGGVVGLAVLLIGTWVDAQVIRPLNPISGGVTSYAQSINMAGLVVGYSTTSSSLDLPTLWRPGAGGVYTGEALPLPAGTTSGGANAISSTGIVVGYAQPAAATTAVAVMWTPTGPGGAYVANTLAAPAGMNYNAAYGVNSAGYAAGFGGNFAGDSVAMAWSPAGVALPPVTALTSGNVFLATGINDAGDVAGYGVGPSRPLTSYVWHPDGAGGYVKETVIAVESAAVTAISLHGTGAGVYNGDQAMVMALYEGDYYATTLPVPYGSSDSASDAVNNLDGLVGYAKDPTSTVTGDEAAFWVPTDTFWDYVNLDRWLDKVSPSLGNHWQLQEATGINDAWLAVGNGLYNQFGSPAFGGLPRGFVLDVSSLVPEPGTVFGLAGAVVFFGLKRRGRRAV